MSGSFDGDIFEHVVVAFEFQHIILLQCVVGLFDMPQCLVVTTVFTVLQVGLLDIDICGPSIPKMLGLEGEEIHQSNAGWSPVYVEDNLGVMSIGRQPAHCSSCMLGS